MLNHSIQPSTESGIKRYARQIKKSTGITHTEALNIAAQKAGFQNYKHAKNNLQGLTTNNQSYQLFLSAYWYDRKNYKSGREVLEIKLTTPLLEIATKGEFLSANTLMRFRLALDDHFVCDDVSYGQSEARSLISKAVRVLRFMEATGLKPSKDYNAAYPDRDRENRLPNADHSTDWYDPETGQFILIDEPYLPAVVTGNRADWAETHNWYLQASKWAGMYAPGESSMFVATDASTGYDFKGLMAKVDGIVSGVTEETWQGLSSKGFDPFLSPLTVTEYDQKRAVAKGTIYRTSSSKTMPMKTWDDPSNERRPNAVMSVEDHQYAARLIKAVEQSTEKPIAVNARLSTIKSKLEDWFFSEHDSAVTDKCDLFYYGDIDTNDPLALRASSTKGVNGLLQELKDTLQKAYVDCEPLRKMIRKLDTSMKSTSKRI